jgi:hypothetical protein
MIKDLTWGGYEFTWGGYEFLDSIKNDTIWNKLKAEMSKAGLFSAPMEVIKFSAIEIAKSYARQHLGLP